jgi:hypothetical protein
LKKISKFKELNNSNIFEELYEDAKIRNQRKEILRNNLFLIFSKHKLKGKKNNVLLHQK